MAGKRSEQILRMYADPCGESASLNKKPESIIPQGVNLFKVQMSTHPAITVSHAGATSESVVLEAPEDRNTVPEQASGSQAAPILPQNMRRKKELRIMVEELYIEYRKYLELMDSVVKSSENLIYIQDTPEEYKRKLEKRFQTLMKSKKEETLRAIHQRLLKVLEKERRRRLKELLKKKERYKSKVKQLGYNDEMQAIAGRNDTTDPTSDSSFRDLQATQRWINQTFRESWKPNRAGDIDDFHGQENDSYLWADYCKHSVQQHVPPTQTTKVIRSADELKGQCAIASTGYLQPEEMRPQGFEGTPCLDSASLTSLLRTRPVRRPPPDIKPSDLQKRYVLNTFNPQLKADLLGSFAFELFDDD